MLIEVISVVVDFLFLAVFVKLFEFFLFVVIVFALAIEVEAGAFLIEGGLLLLFWVRAKLLLGKKR